MKRVFAGLVLALGGAGHAAAAELKVAPVVESLRLKGDLRLRHESFLKEPDVDRHRERFRLRLGAEALLPHDLRIEVGFASGNGEANSTNQSFDNLSGQKSFFFDRAFVRWAPELSEDASVGLAAGRMANPFWTPYAADAVWDADFSPEGAAESFDWLTPAGFQLFGTALQMVADEDSGSNRDQWMLGQQLGAEFRLPGRTRLRAAAAYYEWLSEGTSSLGGTAQEGNRRTGGVLSSEFGVLEGTMELRAWLGETPLSLQGTFLKNLAARDGLLPKEDSGFQAGAILGSAAAEGSWEAAWFYKRLETDATVADLTDSDFGDGGTNRKGHIGWAAYNPLEWLQVKAKIFVTEVVNEALSPGKDDIVRGQLDWSVKF